MNQKQAYGLQNMKQAPKPQDCYSNSILIVVSLALNYG